MNDYFDIKPDTNVEMLLKCDLVASKTNEIDAAMKDFLNTNSPAKIDIDMRNVEMIDSSGISFLLTMQNYLKERKCQLVLNNLSGDIIELFMRMRLNSHLKVEK